MSKRTKPKMARAMKRTRLRAGKVPLRVWIAGRMWWRAVR